MHTKTCVAIVLLALAFASAFSCLAKDTEPLSRDEILALLPRGIDMEDANDIARYKRLVALGPSVHELLGEELLRVEDWTTASRIIAIFVDSRGDKAVAQKYLERFLKLPRNGNTWSLIRWQATEAIKKLQSERSFHKIENTMNPPKKSESEKTFGSEPPTLATPIAASTPARSAAQAPVLPAERQSPMWPWVVGVAALIAVIAVALKRRAS